MFRGAINIQRFKKERQNVVFIMLPNACKMLMLDGRGHLLVSGRIPSGNGPFTKIP
jgi:hypothetical protein